MLLLAWLKLILNRVLGPAKSLPPCLLWFLVPVPYLPPPWVLVKSLFMLTCCAVPAGLLPYPQWVDPPSLYLRAPLALLSHCTNKTLSIPRCWTRHNLSPLSHPTKNVWIFNSDRGSCAPHAQPPAFINQKTPIADPNPCTLFPAQSRCLSASLKVPKSVLRLPPFVPRTRQQLFGSLATR